MMYGVDYGREGSDKTGFTIICPSCRMIHTTTVEPGPIGLVPIWLDCPCGTYTDIRTASQPTVAPTITFGADCTTASGIEYKAGTVALVEDVLRTADNQEVKP